MTLHAKQKCPDGQHLMEGSQCIRCDEFVGGIGKSCQYGIRLFGPKPPPCVQCELAWCEMMLPVKKAAYEKAKEELDDVRRRAAAVTNAA